MTDRDPPPAPRHDTGRSKPVRPRVEERDSRGAPVRRGTVEILHAPKDLYASMTKRSAEHPVAGQENGLEIARDKRMGGWVIQQAR